MAAIGNAKFGSGLASVVFGRPHQNHILVAVTIAAWDHVGYNEYHSTSHAAAAMNLDKTTNVNVRVQCSALGYDSGALGVDGDLAASYHDIANVDNDALVKGDDHDCWAWRGDSRRYFLISGAEAGTDYSIDVSTDAVSTNVAPQLRSLTLTASTLAANDLDLGIVACMKHSCFSTIGGEKLYDPTWDSDYHGWNPDAANDPEHAYGTPELGTISNIVTGSATFTFSGITLANEELIAIGSTSGVVDFVYVTGLSGGTFVAEYESGTVYDFATSGSDASTTIYRVNVAPRKGIFALHLEQIISKNAKGILFQEDYIYQGTREADRYLPRSASASTRRTPIVGGRDFDAMTTISYNRATATRSQLALLNQARMFFLQPAIIEAGQVAALCFGWGDQEYSYINNLDHSAIPAQDFGGTLWDGDASDKTTFNPFTDANYAARLTERVTQTRNINNIWGLYFGGLNPETFIRNKTEDGLPNALTVVSADPETDYGVVRSSYYLRTFAIETGRYSIIVPDPKSRRGGAPPSNYAGNPYYLLTSGGSHVLGGEGVLGQYQQDEIDYYFTQKSGSKIVGFALKGKIIADAGINNTDSPIISAPAETAERITVMKSLQDTTLVACADSHTQTRAVSA